MRISIITPSYQQADFIRYTLDSIHGQNDPDLEHLVMDGGSTDGTVEILRGYDAPSLTWVSEPDAGQSDAINQGLRRATGEIHAYLNSDDALMPGSLAHIRQLFDEKPDVDLVYGAVITIDEHHRFVTDELRPSPLDWWTVLTMRLVLPQQGIFWRRRVTETLGDFDAALHYRMDYDYWIRALLAGFRWQRTERQLAQYRVHSASKSLSQDDLFWHDWLSILDKIYVRKDLPAEVIRLRDVAYNYGAFYAGRSTFYQGHYRQARQHLVRFLRGPAALPQKGLAALMWGDTLWARPWLHDTFTRVYRRVRGLGPSLRHR